jgi:hypothetical protein
MGILTRRQLVLGIAGTVGGLALPPWAVNASAYALGEDARKALRESPLVYISPLKSNGEESRCHGEVWYYADGDDVCVGSTVDTWKVKAVNNGLDRARVWIADYGPQWRALNRYRSAPGFLARAAIDESREVYEGLMASHARRYAGEWGRWEEKFRQQYASGERKILRYTPIAD